VIVMELGLKGKVVVVVTATDVDGGYAKSI
jgi:hypothetical protein